MQYPSTIPIFALPNVVLFPDVPLPLHIFEPRYRDMVRDAIAADGIIGMAMLRGDWQRRYEERPDIFEIACAGRIVNSEPLPDGKFNILLRGLQEVRIEEHVFEKSYRQARIRWCATDDRGLEGTDRESLVELLERYLGRLPASPVHRILKDDTLSDRMLVNFFSYALDIDPLEKQCLLEASGLSERATRLHDLLEFHLEEDRINVPLPSSDRPH